VSCKQKIQSSVFAKSKRSASLKPPPDTSHSHTTNCHKHWAYKQEKHRCLSCGRCVEPLYQQQLRSLRLKPRAKLLLFSKLKISSTLQAIFLFAGIYIYHDFPNCETLIIDKITSILVGKGGKENFVY
jgi:hypothetical protein